MKRLKLIPLALLLSLALAVSAHALTIDYAYVGSHDYDSLGQGVYDAIGEQVWMFTHASVGGNILAGMDSLHSSDPNKYQLTTPYVSSTTPTVPTIPVPGSVYDINRGNPGPSAKYAYFETVTTTGGWGAATDFVMDKLCYIDEDADVNEYFQTIEDILGANPSAKVVLTTMPLTTGENSDNVLRNQYNDEVRSYAASHNMLLFDIADLEAHDADGNPITFESGGTVYQKLFSGWSSDGGHLSTAGRVWVAQGWYAMAASQATPIPGAAWLLGTGLVGLVGLRRRFWG